MHFILEWREDTAVANTQVEDLCVGGVAILLNDGEADTVGCRSNGPYGVCQEKACGERLSDNDLWTHALH